MLEQTDLQEVMRLWIGSFVMSSKFALRSLRMVLTFDEIILLLKEFINLGYDLNLGPFLALEGGEELQGIILIISIIIVIVTIVIFLGLPIIKYFSLSIHYMHAIRSFLSDKLLNLSL